MIWQEVRGLFTQISDVPTADVSENVAGCCVSQWKRGTGVVMRECCPEAGGAEGKSQTHRGNCVCLGRWSKDKEEGEEAAGFGQFGHKHFNNDSTGWFNSAGPC